MTGRRPKPVLTKDELAADQAQHLETLRLILHYEGIDRFRLQQMAAAYFERGGIFGQPDFRSDYDDMLRKLGDVHRQMHALFAPEPCEITRFKMYDEIPKCSSSHVALISIRSAAISLIKEYTNPARQPFLETLDPAYPEFTRTDVLKSLTEIAVEHTRRLERGAAWSNPSILLDPWELIPLRQADLVFVLLAEREPLPIDLETLDRAHARWKSDLSTLRSKVRSRPKKRTGRT